MSASRIELVKKLQTILDKYTLDPAAELILIGTAMVEIGKELEGHSVEDARAVIKSVIALENV
jgi:hypothetical protein